MSTPTSTQGAAPGETGRPAILSSNTFPRGVVPAAGLVLLAIMVAVAAVRFSGTPIREPDAATVSERSLRFEDRPNGDVAILDARDGRVLAEVQGEAGFLRGTLRALIRERKRSGVGAGPAFVLSGRADGRLTLADPATGQRIDLDSFGAVNASIYAKLLADVADAGKPAPARQP